MTEPNPVDALPPGEISRRLPGLQREFGQPSDLPMIACVNVDWTWLPTIEGIDPASVVSTAHVVVRCQTCNDEMWIGPKQAKATGTRICYVCMMILMASTGSQPETVMLDPDADRIPRRFA